MTVCFMQEKCMQFVNRVSKFFFEIWIIIYRLISGGRLSIGICDHTCVHICKRSSYIGVSICQGLAEITGFAVIFTLVSFVFLRVIELACNKE